MTPVRSVKNQYLGINAHLHSYFQSAGGWDGFHTNHITDLMRLMSAQLLPMGYVADIQQSLQIRRLGEPAGRPESDVTIYDTEAARRIRPTSLPAGQALAISDVMSLERELAEYQAIGIYEYEVGKPELGEPVAWIELLSPSNKPGGQDAAYYHDKRLKLLQSGIVFVELDFLHESPSTFDRIPRYGPGDKGEQDSHPYLIVVVDPRPKFREGTVFPHGFDADEEIPTAPIPLNAGDILPFDFGAAYNKTFAETLYGARLVDYSQLPLNFDGYSRNDQARILARMLAVLKAARDGVDLERAAPLQTQPLELEAALAMLQGAQ